MWRILHFAREEVLVAPQAGFLQPGRDSYSRWLRQLELYRPLCLPLDDHCAGEYLISVGYIAHMQIDQIAATQFAVNGQIEHGQVTNRMRVLQVDPNGPDVLRLEGRLLPDEFPLIPGFALLVGFHFRLLGC
jgi:hypothetical protein